MADFETFTEDFEITPDWFVRLELTFEVVEEEAPTDVCPGTPLGVTLLNAVDEQGRDQYDSLSAVQVVELEIHGLRDLNELRAVAGRF